MSEGWFIEHNGDCWQSVFPTAQAHLSQLHTTIEDALDYMVNECAILPMSIVVIEPAVTVSIGER